MKKNKKFKNKIEISMTAPEVLELLNFFSYIRYDKEAWCPTIGKLNQQLYELVISRIEGREPKPFIKTTEDVVMEIDQKKLQKLAFTPPAVDRVAYMSKLHNAATPEEIIETMSVEPAEKVITAGEISAIQRKKEQRDALLVSAGFDPESLTKKTGNDQ